MALRALDQDYSFWYQPHSDKYDKAELHLLANFNSVQQFWALYQHLKRPSQLQSGDNIYCFKKGIQPVWQDKSNVGGGSFVLKLKPNFCDKMWQDLLLGFLGRTSPSHGTLNGVRIKMDSKQVMTVQVWTGCFEKGGKEQQQIQEWIQKTLGLTSQSKISFAPFKKK